MSYSHSSIRRIDATTAETSDYDAVIVGAGVSGAIIAKQLSESGFRVLILEAGPGQEMTIPVYESYLRTFYSAVSKDNNAPFPVNANAPMPRSPETQKLNPGQPDATGYIVQNGPFALDSTYTRVVGGTTMHWQASTPRMIPEDFQMRTRFGQGLDWPVSYDEIEPYYQKAEFEIGVSADVELQAYEGIHFAPGYVFPMRGIPVSYLDKVVAQGVDGMEIELDGEVHRLNVRQIPQGRNGVPNPAYDNGKGYVPVGAVSTHQAEQGERCQGNNNCTPLCPVQAKYDARKTLAKALATGRVDLLAQAVASRVVINPETGRVTAIDYKIYKDATSSEHRSGTVRGKTYVLAANAVENARLMLASGLPSTSGMMGRHLMDHPYLLAWGLLPQIAGTMRGTQSTSGIEDLRGGAFRSRHAAFRVDIHNDGWGWATGSPFTDLVELVDDYNKFGASLREGLVQRISRQLLFAFMVELEAEPTNRITVDPAYKDALGNPRPVLSFNVSDYAMGGIAFARHLSKLMFQRLGVEDYTHYDPSDYGYVSFQGQGYAVRGGNHWAGTHIMGTTKRNSVVDSYQRSWDHPNLYLAGAGSMPTIGTANTTLTLAALCFRTVEQMVSDLNSSRSIEVQQRAIA